jgi:hypothetical protein
VVPWTDAAKYVSINLAIKSGTAVDDRTNGRTFK